MNSPPPGCAHPAPDVDRMTIDLSIAVLAVRYLQSEVTQVSDRTPMPSGLPEALGIVTEALHEKAIALIDWAERTAREIYA